jgi:hypothetical protein
MGNMAPGESGMIACALLLGADPVAAFSCKLLIFALVFSGFTLPCHGEAWRIAALVRPARENLQEKEK